MPFSEESAKIDPAKHDKAKDRPVPASSITIPKGGGPIRGLGEKFANNPATGTTSFSVPIFTSPGRQGFGPELSLSYDSGGGNGIFGLGWSLSIPSITRKTAKGLPLYRDHEDSDIFILSGAEDLVPVLDQNGARLKHDRGDYEMERFRPRTEGLFARIERWVHKDTDEAHWRSVSKENIASVYGFTFCAISGRPPWTQPTSTSESSNDSWDTKTAQPPRSIYTASETRNGRPWRCLK